MVDIHLGIGACQPRLATPVPIGTLYASEHLPLYTRNGGEVETSTTQGIVDAEATLFVGTEDESTTKLIVHIAHGEFSPLDLALHIEVRDTPALKIGLEAGQRVLSKLEASASINIPAHHIEVGICIGERPAIVATRTDACILLRKQHIALDATMQHHLLLFIVVFLCRHCKRQQSYASEGCQ